MPSNPEGSGKFIYRSTEEERSYERSYLNIEEAHKKAEEALKEYEVKPEMFSGLYGEEVIARDQTEVARLKEEFGIQPSKNYADIFEAIVCEHGELSEWFGSGVEVIKTSQFDDIKKGIDMIVEFQEKETRFSHLALGIDVTFGGKSTLYKKLVQIKRKIDTGQLGEIKYFHSDRQNFTGRLQKVPQVVVGIEKNIIEELGLLWVNRKNKELGSHPIQSAILEQIREQLMAFMDYCTRTGKTDLVTIYEKDLNIINELIKAKKGVGLGALSGDRVYLGIKETTKQLFSEEQK